MTDMLSAAKALLSCGYSVIRVSTDGTKSPDVGRWGRFQDELPTVDELEKWFANNHPGIGVVTGAISGNLEMLEFEGRAIEENLHAAFFQSISDAGGSDLLARVVAGYCESSPSGGLHFFYRIEDESVGGNTKLAQRPAFDEEMTDDERKLLVDKGKRSSRTLIETRGEHGFVVVAPSHGPVHATGKPWAVLNGSIANVATITGEERDLIHSCARSLDQVPLPPPIPDPQTYQPNMLPGDLAPGEDYNLRASWSDILMPHGWTMKRNTGIRAYWCRPGKRDGISAVTGGEQGDYFYAWSTSTELPAETTLSKWRVYTFLEHGGDFAKAASALRTKGFGSPRRDKLRAVQDDDGWMPGDVMPGASDSPPADGSGASNGQLAPSPVAVAAPTMTVLFSDDGNAQTLIERYGSVIKYCPERGQWLTWQGTKWEWAEGKNGGIVREYAKKVARSLPDNDKEAMKHRRYSLSAMGTTNMLVQAATSPGVAIRLNNLDDRPYELNTPAGIVDLRTGQILPHLPDHLHTRMTLCAPDFDADQTRWQLFLQQTFAGHEEILPYIQRLAGYSASGVVNEHVLPFAFGPGRNGKGVFLESIRKILGDYGTVAPNAFLMAQQYSQHETEIARLAGTRMVLCSEVNVQDKFDEAKVKLLTGGDTLTARFMRQNHFTFEPTHKLWLMGNDQPSVSSGGPAFWERLRIIPFSNTVPREYRIMGLQDILASEHGPAILAWVIAGAYGYFNGGLQEPESVMAATTGYAHSQDTIAQWMQQWCELTGNQNDKINKTIVRKSYEDWCRIEGATPATPQKFGRVLKADFGINSSSSNGKAWYYGLTVNAEVERLIAQQGFMGLDR